jgi:hypothetical protein
VTFPPTATYRGHERPLAALAVAVLLGATPPPSRTLVAGPALAGDRVEWGEQRGKTNVVVGAGSGVLLWQSRSAWLAGPLAASRSTTAFATGSSRCSGTNTACPVETTFFAERPGHGWLPITPPVRCVSATAGRRLAVSGPLVATVTPNCDSPSKGTLRVRRDGRMVFRRAGVECCDVVSDLAGRTRVLARFSGRLEQVGSFDASTRTVTWSSRRITRTRLDCPPPRQVCMVRKTGTLTIWRAGTAGGAAHAVAGWAFTDTP